MFKALLDWIRPTDNNVQLSSKFKKVLQRIIDTVFDSMGLVSGAHLQHNPSELQFKRQYGAQDLQSQEENLSTVIDSQHDVDPELTTINDMDWLNTVDWTQGSWLEQSNPSFLLSDLS